MMDVKEACAGKKRVLFVISTLNTGGAQRAFANLSMGFPENYECDFLLNDTENITYPYRGNLISLGLRPKKDKTKLWYQLRVLWKRCHMLRHLKKEGGYDACISGLTSANAANVLTRDKNCKAVISIRTFTSKDNVRGIKGLINGWAVRHLYNKADLITTVSESAKADLIANYGIDRKKVCTIYNGYGVQQIKRLAGDELTEREKDWFAKNRRVIVTMGRLAHEKGQWHLIKAMKAVREQIPGICLLLLGEGELESRLKSLSKRCGLQNTVLFGGFSHNPYPILSKCDLFVLPSLYEGFPNALAEAMCCGLPVVAADFDSGAREILAPGTNISDKTENRFEAAEYGVLCPMMDGIYHEADEEPAECEKYLAEAILYLLCNPEIYKKYRAQSLRRAEHFRMETIIQEWMNVIAGAEKNENQRYRSDL